MAAAARARRGSSADTLINKLPSQPVLDIRRAQELTGSTKTRTYEALDRLVEAGVLAEVTGQRPDRVWVAADIMTELAELESRIGKRGPRG